VLRFATLFWALDSGLTNLKGNTKQSILLFALGITDIATYLTLSVIIGRCGNERRIQNETTYNPIVEGQGCG
jgi:hypothetical protein